MIRLVTILLFVLTYVPAHAQADKAGARNESLNISVRQGQQSLQSDTLTPSQADSLKIIRSIKDSLKIAHAVGKADSIAALTRRPSEYASDKIVQAQQVILNQRDTLLKPVTSARNRVNDAWQAKTDSLRHSAAARADAATQKLEEKAGILAGKDAMQIQDDKLALPEQEMPGIPVPGMPPPAVPPDAANMAIGGADHMTLPATTGIDANAVNVKGLGDVQQATAVVDELSSKAEAYGETVSKARDAKPENIEQVSADAENKLAETAPMREAAGELSKVAQEKARQEAMLQKYRDHKLMQEEIKRKAEAIANDHVAKHAGKLKDAQRQLENSKAQAGKVKQLKDIFKRRSDELDGKKFYQRLVPGITWQVYKKEIVSSDLALQVGYRITPRLTAGIGGIYRLGFSEDFDSFVQGMGMYGSRAYFDFTLKKSLFLHGEFEALCINNIDNAAPGETKLNKAYGSYFGLGKRFNITRNLRGNILGVFRLDYQGAVPDINKVNARFGVEYVFKRPRRKLPGA